VIDDPKDLRVGGVEDPRSDDSQVAIVRFASAGVRAFDRLIGDAFVSGFVTDREHVGFVEADRAPQHGSIDRPIELVVSDKPALDDVIANVVSLRGDAHEAFHRKEVRSPAAVLALGT
jgi:hypothetical protein